MCIRRLRNWAGGKRRSFLPHNTKAMIGIVAHLFDYSLSQHASLCLLFYLLCFLYLLSILYDGLARQVPRRFPLIHEHCRLAHADCPPDSAFARSRSPPLAVAIAVGL